MATAQLFEPFTLRSVTFRNRIGVSPMCRKEAHITQEQLADKIGTKKSYISRLENGKADIQLSTLFKIFETGLGRKIRLTII